MQIETLNRKDKKEIFGKLKESYGFSDKTIEELMGYQYFFTGKDKIRMFSGNLDLKNFMGINKQMNVQNIGVYFATNERNFLRLGFDILVIYGKYATKNFVVLNQEQREDWIQGYEIQLTEQQCEKLTQEIIIVKDFNGNILSSGLLKNNVLFNYLPKEARNSLQVFIDG